MNIMVIDDDAVCRQSATEALAPLARVAPRQFDSAASALQALAEGYPPDLIVVDIRMPEVDGLALLGRLRQDSRWAPVPVMMITATPERGTVQQALQMGVQGFILKPLGPDALLRVRAVRERFQAMLIEPAESACRRQVLPLAHYWHSVMAVQAQLQQLLDALIAAQKNDPPQDAIAQRSTLRRQLESCVTVTRTLGMTLARPVLTGLQKALANGTALSDAHVEEWVQALALHQHWLQGYCRGHKPAPVAGAALRV